MRILIRSIGNSLAKHLYSIRLEHEIENLGAAVLTVFAVLGNEQDIPADFEVTSQSVPVIQGRPVIIRRLETAVQRDDDGMITAQFLVNRFFRHLTENP